MANDVVNIRLNLDTSGAAGSAKAVAQQIKQSLGAIKIDNNIIDLSNSRKQTQALVGDILKVKTALAPGSQVQGLQKELAIYREQVRFKEQLSKINANSVTPEGAKNARALAIELNRLNLQKIEQQFKASADAATKLGAATAKIDSKGLLSLSKALGQSYGDAQKFAQSLGLSGQAANEAFQRFSQLRGAGANTLTAYAQLTKEFGLNAAQLKVVNKAYQDLQVRQAGAAASAKQFGQAQQKAYADASKSIADLASKVASAQQSLGNASDNKQASRSAALFAENLRYKQEMAKIQNAGFSPQDVASAQSLANELNKLNIQKIEQDFNQLSTTARAGLQGIAIAAGAVATAVASLFAAGLKEFTEFDGAIRQSGAVAGATEDELKALSEEVTRLGSTTTKAPAEIARMSTELARAGFTSEETTAALEGIVFASEATGESLSTVGDIIAKTLRVFNKDAEDSGEVADLLVQTANSTNTSVGGLGESLKYVGAQAAASNQDLETILVSLGLLGDAGIQGTQAGSNLAQALERLKIASAGSVTQFQGLVRGQKGATAAFEAINAQVRDSEGNLKQVTEILPIIKAQLANLPKEDQEVLMKALFGVQGGRAFQTLLNASPARIAEVTQSVQDAQGVAGETSARLREGLSGAVALFQGTASTFLKEFGAIAAVPVEPFVRGATELVRVFNNLPAPIQAALVATTGFIGVLLTATAAIATYNLANGKLIFDQTLAAGKIVFNTTVTGANALAKGAAAAAELAWARATGTATAAQTAQINAIGSNVAKFGLLAAAIGSVTLAVNEYQESTKALEGTQEAIDGLAESTLKLKEAFADAAKGTPEEGAAQLESIAANIQSVKDGFSQVDKLLEAIRERIDSTFKPLDLLPDQVRNAIGAINPIFGALSDGTTKLEAQLNNQSIAFEEFRQSIEKDVLAPYEELANADGGLSKADPAKLAAVEGSIDKAIEGLERFKDTSPEAAFAVDVLLKSLNRSKLAIDQQKDAQLELNEATEEGEKRISEQIQALEEQQRAAKEAADDARADAERQLNRKLDDERRERQESNEEELNEIRKANEAEIAAIEKTNSQAIAAQEKKDALEVANLEKQLQAEIQQAERDFEEEITTYEEQRQAGLQAKEQAFQQGQQQQEAAFQDRQRQIEAAFQEAQRQRNEAQGESFEDAERLINLQSASTRDQRETILQQQRAIDRVEQLNLADQVLPPERIAELARQVAEVGSSIDTEDEAKRAQEAVGLIRAEQQRQQAEADRLAEEQRQAAAQAREAKFQAEQEQRRTAFEEAIALQRKALEDEIEARKLDFETNVLTPAREEQEARVAALREQQELNLTAIREQQEASLQVLREEQEADLEARRAEFEANERALDRQYEDEKIARDRAYREEQRRLDRENAQAIENIRSANRSSPGNATTPTESRLERNGIQARKDGGPVQAGQPYLVGEEGPELILPRRNGFVMTAPQTAQIVANLRRNAGLARAPVARFGGGGGTDPLLKEIKAMNRKLDKLGRPNETTNVAIDTNDPMASLRARARELGRRLR